MSEAALKNADMSASPFVIVPKRTTRTENNRKAKQRSRAKAAAAGLKKLEVVLTASDAQLVGWVRKAQSGNPETFLGRALVVGAKFLFNAGNVCGGKKRIKGGAR